MTGTIPPLTRRGLSQLLMGGAIAAAADTARPARSPARTCW